MPPDLAAAAVSHNHHSCSRERGELVITQVLDRGFGLTMDAGPGAATPRSLFLDEFRIIARSGPARLR